MCGCGPTTPTTTSMGSIHIGSDLNTHVAALLVECRLFRDKCIHENNVMNARWIAMLDADEFLYPASLYDGQQPSMNVTHHIVSNCPAGSSHSSVNTSSVLCNHLLLTDLSYIMIRWQVYGSNGMYKRPDGSTIDYYRMHSKVDESCPPKQMGCFEHNPPLSTKLIVNTKCVNGMGTHYVYDLTDDPECKTIYVRACFSHSI